MPGVITIDALCDDLAAEHAVVDCMVSDLTPGDWELPTPSEPWTVRDQIAHLAFFDERAHLAIEDGAAFRSHLADIASDPTLLTDGHLDLGGRDGPASLDEWRSRRRHMLSRMRRLGGGERIPWYGPDMSARSFITARLMETWAHGQDVADALGIEREASARLVHIAHLGVTTFAWSHVVHGLPVPESPPRVELAGPGGTPSIWNEGGEGSVVGPLQDFCLVVTQRRHVDDTSLVVDGAVARRWMEIAQCFAGPPGPGRSPGMGT